MVLPTCSEAQCGSVTVAMSFGLPILASREADFSADEVEILPDCSPETLRSVVREWARRPATRVIEQSRRTFARAVACYRPEHYERSLRAALEGVA